MDDVCILYWESCRSEAMHGELGKMSVAHRLFNIIYFIAWPRASFYESFIFFVCSNRSSRLLLHSVYLESCGVLCYLSTDAMLCLLVRLSKLSNLLSMGSRVSSLRWPNRQTVT